MQGKIDVQKLSSYFNNIVKLIYKYEIMSLFKIEFSSFIITMNEFTGLQNAGAKRNLVSRFLLNLHYYFLSNYQDFFYINEVINILENNNYIALDGDKISVINQFDLIDNKYFSYSSELEETIKEIKNMTVESFKEEVVNNV